MHVQQGRGIFSPLSRRPVHQTPRCCWTADTLLGDVKRSPRHAIFDKGTASCFQKSTRNPTHVLPAINSIAPRPLCLLLMVSPQSLHVPLCDQICTARSLCLQATPTPVHSSLVIDPQKLHRADKTRGAGRTPCEREY